MAEQQLKRTTYRDPNSPELSIRTGNTVRAESATDMDSYYRPLEAIHNSSLHGWGVASGLRVTATLNSQGVTVLPGVALQGVMLQAGVMQEGSGRHISLAANGEAEIGPHADAPGTPATLVSVTATGVVLPTTGLSGDKYVTIQFRETFDIDEYNENQNYRYNHTPWLRLIDVAGFVDDGSRVVLAQVSLDANGNVTALSQGLRRGLDLPTQSIHLHKGINASPAPNFAVDSADAGKIVARATGGIDVTVVNATDEIHLAGENGNFAKLSVAAEQIVALRSSDGKETVTLAAEQGNIAVGTNGVAGSVTIIDANGNRGLSLQEGGITAGTKGVDGSIAVTDANGNQGLTLQRGSLSAGTKGVEGSITLTDANGNQGLTLQGSSITAGTNGVAGSIIVTDASGKHGLNLQGGSVTVGMNGVAGSIAVTDANGNQGLTLEGGSVTAGTKGVAGSVVVTDASGNQFVALQGSGITAGTNGVSGSITVNDNMGHPAVLIQGNPATAATATGRIITATLHSSYSSETDFGSAIYGTSTSGNGVYGQATNAFGVYGQATNGVGVQGDSGGAAGVIGTCTNDNGNGVSGRSTGIAGAGVFGQGSTGVFGTGVRSGVSGQSRAIAISAQNMASGIQAKLATTDFAGDFLGNIHVTGTIVSPNKGFKIDHPLDPARKYLIHSNVESPEMKDMYDGVAVLDTNGEVIVELPTWFEALNMDFRYQLTCIGDYAPVYIAEKVHDNRFKIAGGKPGMEVSWQITGIRQDAWAKAYRMPVEEDKPTEEQGHYLHPEVHGESEEKHVWRARYPEVAQPIAPGSQPLERQGYASKRSC